jgi:hypothetical protein
MPVGPGRYRMMTTKSGKQVRLHFGPGGTVNEAKNMATGAVHTPAEFAHDRTRSLRDGLAAHAKAGRFKKKGTRR